MISLRHTRRAHPSRRALGIVVALTLVATGCSSDASDDSSSAAPPTTAPTATSTEDSAADPSGPQEWTPPVCEQGAAFDQVDAVKVEDPELEHDWTITSADGTEIRAHWFPRDGATADAPVPTVLMGPGWSLAGDTSQTGDSLFGGMSIPSIQDAGYNVLTWDPRGFGASTGTASVNDPDKEGKDAQMLLDWVATQPEARLDADGDPRVGMVGASYGGGIQLTLAQIDCRVDALVPTIAWNSLESALYRNETVKVGWAGTLLKAAAGRDLDPHVESAFDSGTADGTISDEDQDWFRSRGPGPDLSMQAPTLFIQGTVDTLFTPDEAVANHESLKKQGVPTAMVWFCGGHGVCITEPGDEDRTTEATFTWLKRYLDEDESVDTGPAFSTIDQDGTEWTASDYPVAADEEITASGSGTLEIPDGAKGALATIPKSNDSPLGGLVGGITPGPAPADEAVELRIDTGDVDGVVLGSPTLELTYEGTIAPGDQPVRVFAQLVDDERQVVVGNLVTPIALELDGESHTVSVDLETVAQHVSADQPLTLQIVAATATYAVGRTGGSVTFATIDLTAPLVTEGLTET